MRRLIAAAVVVCSLIAVPAAGAATAPVLSGSVSDPVSLSGATSVAVSGHYAYTTAYFAGELTAVDIANPAAPVVTGSSAFSNNLLAADTVNIVGGYAYVVSKNRNGTNGSGSNDDGSGNSLTILNVSTNPAKPMIVGSVRDATKLFGSYGVAISGNYAYVAAQGCLSGQPCPKSNVGNAFEVVNISNPATPAIVATIHNTSLLDHACSVAVSGHYAYVTAAYTNRLTVIDIASPLAPTIVASVQDNTAFNFPVDVAVQGHYAYVADQAQFVGRVAVVDVTDPTHPQVTGTVTNATALNGAYRIRVNGNFAYTSGVYAATVAAIDVSDPTSPRVAGSATSTTHLNRTTGLDLDAGAKHVVASSPYLSSQSQPVYPPFPPATGAPTMTGSISVITLDPSPISVTITPSSEPPNPTAQTGAQFSFSTNDAVASVACRLDSGALGPCTSATSQTYSNLAPGSHTFVVQATDAAGTTATASYAWTIQSAQQAPANSTPPAVSGSAVSGQTLNTSDGTWTGTPAPTYTYQWSDCDSGGANCNAIGGATSSSYTVGPSDAGFTLEATVIATNTAGSAQASSAPTAVVPTPPVNSTPPAISGSAVSGQTLNTSDGTWTGTPAPTYTYQWSDCDTAGANCNAIGGATSSSYTVGPSDAGFTLEATVIATNTGGSAQASSAPTAVVPGVTSPPNNTAPPSVSGAAVEGQTLTAVDGTWSGSPAPTFTYQWSDCDAAGANCNAISGATLPTYTVLAADVGSTLQVTVTGSNSTGSATAPAPATAVVTSSPGPVTTLLDDFNRANNSGPPGANWSHAPVFSTAAANNLLISSQQITGTSGSNGDYWNVQAFGPNSEAWLTVATRPNVDLDPVVLGVRFTNPGATTATGYQAYYIYRSTPPDQYKISVRVNGATTATLATANGPTLAAGDHLLFRAIGNKLELWRLSGTTWTRVLSAQDSTITGAGYLTLSTRNGAVRLDNFGGGTLP